MNILLHLQEIAVLVVGTGVICVKVTEQIQILKDACTDFVEYIKSHMAHGSLSPQPTHRVKYNQIGQLRCLKRARVRKCF